ncbi:MAG: hypothetical protein H7Y10_04995 [Flavobacterium sp.]|nr:hypothetical protein [Flavobacterium sp.]
MRTQDPSDSEQAKQLVYHNPLDVISFDDNFSSVRVIPLLGGIVSRTEKFSLKTVLDTFFVPFLFTKNTRTDVCNKCTQRVKVNFQITTSS